MRQVPIPLVAVILALVFGMRPGTSEIPTAKLAGGETQVTVAAKKRAITSVPPVWEVLCKLNPNYGSISYLEKTERELPVHTDSHCLDHLNINITFLIATIADPVHSHLGLNFDRTIDAIQAAAAEAKFLPYLHALPWPPPQDKEKLSQTRNSSSENSAGVKISVTPADKSRHESNVYASISTGDATRSTLENYEYPGVLILKQSISGEKYLAVFLVPELPTSGIDQTTFLTAIRIADAIASKSNRIIHLAGPNFSGSLGQLPRLLEVVNRQAGESPHCIEAVSGTVTNPRDKFLSNNPNCGFTALQTSDQDAMGRFVYAMRKMNGYQPNEIALLSEEGTQYGEDSQESAKQSKPDEQAPLLLHFPREISRLRNAWHSASAAPSSGNPVPVEPELSLNWQDSQPFIRDDILNYGEQTPVSEETVLASLSSTVKANDIKALGILATDPLDTAFLLRFFKKSCPDVRLFLRDPDLLYFRTPDAGSLTGVLVINDFPLIAQNQLWGGGSHIAPVALSSASEEAQYNAFSVLLRKIEKQTKTPIYPPDSPPVAPYLLYGLEAGWPAVPPQSEVDHPLWLGVAGTTGYFPIRMLDPAPQSTRQKKIQKNDIGLVARNEKIAALSSMNVGKPPYATILLLILTVMIGGSHALWVLKPKCAPWRFRDEFDVKGGDWLSATKALCHVMSFLVMALATLLASSSFVFFYYAPYRAARGLVPAYSVFAVLGCAATIALVAAAALTLWNFVLRPWLTRRQALKGSYRRGKPDDVDSDYATIQKLAFRGFPFAGLLILALTWWTLGVFAKRYENAFLHYRDIYLASGVAPVVPLEIFLAIIYGGVWVYLRRLSNWEYGNVEMPNLVLDDAFPCEFAEHVKTIKRYMLGTPGRRWLGVFSAVFFGTLLAFRPWATMDMVEKRSVQWFVIGCFTFGFFMLWVNWFRFVAIWRCLRKILRNLERVPLRWAFTRLPRESSLPIWRWSISDGSFLPSVQGVNIFRALMREDPTIVTPETRDHFIQSVWEMCHPGLPWPNPRRSQQNNIVSDAGPLRVTVLAVSGTTSQSIVNTVRELRAVLYPSSNVSEIDKHDVVEELEQKTADGSTAAHPASKSVPKGNKSTRRDAEVIAMPAPASLQIDPSKPDVSTREKKELLREARKAMTAVITELSASLIAQYWNRGVTAASKSFEQVTDDDRKYILAEDLIALRFYTYIRYVVSELRNLLFYIVTAFSLMFLALHVYAFRADQGIDWFCAILLLIWGTGVVWVLAQMEKDALLSRLEGTTAGELNKKFYLELLKYGIVPFITILGSQIPSVSNVLLRWLQPTLEAFR